MRFRLLSLEQDDDDDDDDDTLMDNASPDFAPICTEVISPVALAAFRSPKTKEVLKAELISVLALLVKRFPENYGAWRDRHGLHVVVISSCIAVF